MRNARAELTALAADCGWVMSRSGAYRTLFEYPAEARLEVRWTKNGRVREAIYWHTQSGHSDQYIYWPARGKRVMVETVLRYVPMKLSVPDPGVVVPDEKPKWDQRYRV